MKSVPSLAPVLPSPAAAAQHPLHSLARVAAAFLAHLPAMRPLLDARALSDHLKRDIGVLDGNDPRGPRM
jgi:hypothetical protein